MTLFLSFYWFHFTGAQPKRSEALGEQLKEQAISYEIRRILPSYDHTCKDVDDLIRQYGIFNLSQVFFRSIHTIRRG